jgi:hypothetical protein
MMGKGQPHAALRETTQGCIPVSKGLQCEQFLFEVWCLCA